MNYDSVCVIYKHTVNTSVNIRVMSKAFGNLGDVRLPFRRVRIEVLNELR